MPLNKFQGLENDVSFISNDWKKDGASFPMTGTGAIVRGDALAGVDERSSALLHSDFTEGGP